MAGGHGTTSTSSPDSPLNQNIGAPGSLGGDITDPSVPNIWNRDFPSVPNPFQPAPIVSPTEPTSAPTQPIPGEVSTAPHPGPSDTYTQHGWEPGYGITPGTPMTQGFPEGSYVPPNYSSQPTAGGNTQPSKEATGGTPSTGGNTQPSKGATGGNSQTPYDSNIIMDNWGGGYNSQQTPTGGYDWGSYNPQPMPMGNSQPSKGATGTGGNTQPSKGATGGYL